MNEVLRKFVMVLVVVVLFRCIVFVKYVIRLMLIFNVVSFFIVLIFLNNL